MERPPGYPEAGAGARSAPCVARPGTGPALRRAGTFATSARPQHQPRERRAQHRPDDVGDDVACAGRARGQRQLVAISAPADTTRASSAPTPELRPQRRRGTSPSGTNSATLAANSTHPKRNPSHPNGPRSRSTTTSIAAVGRSRREEARAENGRQVQQQFPTEPKAGRVVARLTLAQRRSGPHPRARRASAV